jgi:hypothetical protein
MSTLKQVVVLVYVLEGGMLRVFPGPCLTALPQLLLQSVPTVRTTLPFAVHVIVIIFQAS